MKNQKEIMEALLAGEVIEVNGPSIHMFVLDKRTGNIQGQIKGHSCTPGISLLMKNPEAARIKPKTMTINFIEFASPIREMCQLAGYAHVYKVTLQGSSAIGTHVITQGLLDKGLIHLTEEDAGLHSKALLSLSDVSLGGANDDY